MSMYYQDQEHQQRKRAQYVPCERHRSAALATPLQYLPNKKISLRE
jgi:hypothetical protein